jgi:hypothetical protein
MRGGNLVRPETPKLPVPKLRPETPTYSPDRMASLRLSQMSRYLGLSTGVPSSIALFIFLSRSAVLFIEEHFRYTGLDNWMEGNIYLYSHFIQPFLSEAYSAFVRVKDTDVATIISNRNVLAPHLPRSSAARASTTGPEPLQNEHSSMVPWQIAIKGKHK